MSTRELAVKMRKLIEEDMSVLQAAKELFQSIELSPSAIRNRFIRYEKSPEKRDERQLFTDEQENYFVLLLEAFACSDAPHFAAFVKDTYKKDQMWNGVSWANKFLSRYDFVLKHGTIRCLEAKRTGEHLYNSVVKFANDFEQYMLRHKLNVKNLVNADEFRVTERGEIKNMKRITSTYVKSSGFKTKGMGKGASYLPFIQANGTIIMSLYVVPAKPDANGMAEMPVQLKGEDGKPLVEHPVMFATTPSGYVSKELWIQAVEKFTQLWYKDHPGVEPCLLVDGLHIHKNLSALRQAKDSKLHILYLPPHTTHVLQPCDSTIFQVLKSCTLQWYNLNSLNTNQNQGELLLQACQNSECKVTEEVVQKAFSNTGFYPYDREKILINAKSTFSTKVCPKKERNERDKKTVAMLREAIDRRLKTPDKVVTRKRVKSNHMMSGAEVLAAAEAKEYEEAKRVRDRELAAAKRVLERAAAAEAKKAEKEARQKIAGCKGTSHADGKVPTRRKQPENSKWYTCMSCKVFTICTTCVGKDRELIRKHEEKCK